MASTEQALDVPTADNPADNSLQTSQAVNSYMDISKRQFTLFPKLPPELRLKIWGIALSVPRVLVLEQCHNNATEAVQEDAEVSSWRVKLNNVC
jgi:hypothetical protein